MLTAFSDSQCFVDPLRKAAASNKPILTGDKIGLIFSNLDFIRSINGELLNRIKDRIQAWSSQQQIGDVFLDLSDALRYSYAQYINNYDQALKTLSFCAHQEPNFSNFLEVQVLLICVTYHSKTRITQTMDF